MGISPKIKRYVVRILFLTFIISVGLNLYDHFVTLPKMQATTNNMRVHALWEWQSQMMTVKNMLKTAETNLDAYDAWIHATLAIRFLQIYGIEIDRHNPDNLYYWLSLSTSRLDQACMDIYSGKDPGPTSENIGEYVLQKIGNVTQAIENIMNSMKISANGVDPVQYLLEIGNLTNTMNYCNQLIETSTEIINYY